jgi:hypothetical protein
MYKIQKKVPSNVYLYTHYYNAQSNQRHYNGEWTRKLVLCGNHGMFQLLLVEKGTAAKINQNLNKVHDEMVVSRPPCD